MFDIRRDNDGKGTLRFLSAEFGAKHPDFSGYFWGLFASIAMAIFMFGYAVPWLNEQDRIYHEKMDRLEKLERDCERRLTSQAVSFIFN
jgi:hypothetical protein